MAKHDRNIYNKWFQYSEQNFCHSSTEIQPDLQVSAGAMPSLYGEVSSIQGRSNIPAINRINILTACILCYNKYAIAFYTEENEFSILFYGQDDCNRRILSETINMDHPEKKLKMILTRTMTITMMMRMTRRKNPPKRIWRMLYMGHNSQMTTRAHFQMA